MATEIENETSDAAGEEVPAAETAAPESEASVGETPPGEPSPEGTGASGAPSDADGAGEALRASWGKVAESYAKTLAKVMKPAGASQYKSKGKLFISWCVNKGIAPEQAHTALEGYFAHVDALGSAKIVSGISKKSAAGLIEEVKNMAKGTRSDVEEQREEETGAEEEFEEEGEGEGEEEPEEEQPRRRTRRTAPVTERVVYVQAPAPRGRPPGAKDSYQRQGKGMFGQKSVLPRQQMIRVYKRKMGGTRAFIGDYDVNDIGGAIQPFIREVIDPDHGEGEVTTYLVYELDAAGNDRGAPVRVDIEAPADQQQQAMNDPFSTAKRAMEFMNDFRAMQQEQQPQQSEVLQEAKKRAAGNADMNSLMMLMMMERMMGGPKTDESVLLRLMEQLKPQQQLSALPPMPPMPPQMMMPPPPPPQDDTMKVLLFKLMEKSFESKPQQPDFMQQFMMMKQLGLLGNDTNPAAIDQKLAQLEAKFAAAAAAGGGTGGLDGYVNMFTKMREMVTTLAPQMNAGGIIGTIQNFLTPELVKVGGNFVAQVLQQTQQKLQQPNGAVAQPAALPAQTAPAPALKTNPMVDNAANALRIAAGQDEKTLVNQTVELLMACYDDDRFKAQIDVVAQQLMMGNNAPANQFLSQLLGQIRPDLANANFTAKVVAEVITRFNAGGGAQAPAAPVAPAPLPSNVQVGGAAAAPDIAEQLQSSKAGDHVPNETGFVNGTPQNVNVPTAAVDVPNPTAAIV